MSFQLNFITMSNFHMRKVKKPARRKSNNQDNKDEEAQWRYFRFDFQVTRKAVEYISQNVMTKTIEKRVVF